MMLVEGREEGKGSMDLDFEGERGGKRMRVFRGDVRQMHGKPRILIEKGLKLQGFHLSIPHYLVHH